MDLDLFYVNDVNPETPNVLTDDLVAHFNLQRLFRDYTTKKPNRALQLGLKEIVSAEKNLKVPEFSINLTDKKNFFT